MANWIICLDISTVGTRHYRSTAGSAQMSPDTSGMGLVHSKKPMSPLAHLSDVDNDQFRCVE